MILKPINEECLKHWTESAKYCYKIGCNCSQCVYMRELEAIRPDKCRMKSIVLELVRRFGKPILEGQNDSTTNTAE